MLCPIEGMYKAAIISIRIIRIKYINKLMLLFRINWLIINFISFLPLIKLKWKSTRDSNSTILNCIYILLILELILNIKIKLSLFHNSLFTHKDSFVKNIMINTIQNNKYNNNNNQSFLNNKKNFLMNKCKLFFKRNNSSLNKKLIQKKIIRNFLQTISITQNS